MFSDPINNIAQMYIGEGMHVADFGAGVGYHTLEIAKKVGPYGKVYAIDIIPEHLSKIKNEARLKDLKNIEVIHGDLESPTGSGLQNHSVDRVLMVNVLFQNDHPEHILKEAIRITKSKGRIVVIEWLDSFNFTGPHPEHILTKGQALSLFKGTQFTLEKEIDVGDYHYGLLFKRT